KIASALGVKDNPESPFYLPLNELKILNAADCSNVYVNWNCNSTDTEDGGLDANFNLVKDKIFSLNMHNLSDEWYP
ncbi:hypothetical protein KAS50_02690, partial [bacterium]|nr:hypothetical protein [bacterium]